ncbi:MAG: TIGR04086 family membrane protein [Oscillospiraceae bacterium]|nr:TIGR04086 family membrane protein [Oscillospiraceae bacterium]
MREEKRKNAKSNTFAVGVLKGFTFGLVIVAAVFALAAALVSSGAMPESAMPPVAVFAAFLGAFAGAIFALLSSRRRVFSLAMATCAAMLLLTLIGSFFTTGPFSGATPILLAAYLVGGALGGYALTRKPRHRRR